MNGKWFRMGSMVALLLAVAWLLPGPMAAGAQAPGTDSEPMRTISVSGMGQAGAQPDLAVVTLGVRTEAKEAGEALTQNSVQMQAVIDALKAAGVAARDIQTEVLRLSPQFERPAPRAGQVQGPPEVVGFVATNVVEVRVRDLDGLGELLDAAVQAGGNQIEGIRFEIEDTSGLAMLARVAAWEDALAKAEQLAALAGSELGPALTIQESSRIPRPYVERAMDVSAAAAVPIEPGTQTVEVDLQVTWILKEAGE
jgi:uncharacterized protein YggE